MKWLSVLSRSTSVVAAIWLYFIAFLVSANVIGRYFFNFPIPGTPEIVGNSILIIAFLQMAYSIEKGTNMQVNLLLDKLSTNKKYVFLILGFIIGLIFFALVIRAQLPYAIESWLIKSYEGEGSLRIPLYPGRFLLIIGSFIAILQYLRLIYNTIVKLISVSNIEQI